MGIKASWADRERPPRPMGPGGTWTVGGPDGPGDSSPIDPATYRSGRVGSFAAIPDHLDDRGLAAWAVAGARRALELRAAEVEVGTDLDDPLAATALLAQLDAAGTPDPGKLLLRWNWRIRHLTTDDEPFPWSTTPGERALLAPIATFESAELLLRLSVDAGVIARLAADILDELRPAIEDHLATAILADDPGVDTMVLWLLTHHPESLEAFQPLAVALATRYGILARRLDGLIYDDRVPAEPRPLIPASARLARGLWALGLYPTLLGRILQAAARSRDGDGGWSTHADSDGVATPIDTLTTADLLLALDPDHDPSPTIHWLVRHRGEDGWWRQVGREAPWLTAAIAGWLERAVLPFEERFAWPAVPKPSRDRKTGLPRYEYLVDLGRAFEVLPALGGRRMDIAFCDLAHFGEFNKRYGQVAGDDALRHFTTKLQAACPRAKVIRDGGDEFLIVGVPTWVGLRAALGVFCAGWPEAFAERFGADVAVVAPRFTGTQVTADGLLAARERLGIHIGELKDIEAPPSGLVAWA